VARIPAETLALEGAKGPGALPGIQLTRAGDLVLEATPLGTFKVVSETWSAMKNLPGSTEKIGAQSVRERERER
jgi:hypothetical protein